MPQHARGRGAVCAGREQDGKHSPRVYSSLNNSLACVVSPPRLLASSLGCQWDKGTRPWGPLGGRKEEKRERRSPPTPSRRLGRNQSEKTFALVPAMGASPGWALPCSCLCCIFFLNTEVQAFLAPGRWSAPLEGLPPAPLSLLQWSLGVCPPARLTACTSQTGFEEKGGKPRVLRLPGDGKET